MTFEEIKMCIQRDLGVTERCARKHKDNFKSRYKGEKEAITACSAKYDDEGRVVVVYVINSKEKQMTL